MRLRIKYAIEGLVHLLTRVFCLFPLNSRRVLFSSYSGRQYSDSPRAISECLREADGSLEIVWAFLQPENYAALRAEGVRTVRYKSLRYLYYALTAGVYVDNVEFWSALRFRRGQMVLETWHGGGAYKKVGADRQDVGERERRHAVDKMRQVTLFLSSSRAFTERVIRGSYRYTGEVLEAGLPRNDDLIKGRLRARAVFDFYGIPEGTRLLLYAPTFRKNEARLGRGAQSGPEADWPRLRAALAERFSGNWMLLRRSHYYLAPQSAGREAEGIVEVSDYPDMQRLLAAADVLLTDYSSSMWDFSLSGKPCFLLAEDLAAYRHERDFYTPIESWPFPLAHDPEELLLRIRNFDADDYGRRVQAHHEALGARESGEAARRAAEAILAHTAKLSGKMSPTV